MVVIGGGVIGLELGSVWQRLGAKVTVVEFLDRILPGMDGEVSKTMQKILAKQGMKFKLGTKVTSAKNEGEQVVATLEPAAGGAPEKMQADDRVAGDRPPSLHRRAWGWKKSASSWMNANASPSISVFRPTCQASMPSAM